ncbi:hypothetical protein SIID45300_02614 [Candidatus Magnetaquicoccaceae bacterium FCR-1]|uniref:POTRA domain-containing protein n=1 Tax=Candidatus Magnetaquiglobus chichijimensis TaxID=3141448 RepID=A0ABQ0CBM2_9PROT
MTAHGRIRWLASLALAGLAVLFQNHGWAAGLPTDIAPSPQSLRELEERAAPNQPVTENERKGQPGVVRDIEVDPGAQPKPESQIDKAVTFFLKGVKVIGNQTLPNQEIIDVVKPRLEKQVTSAELQDIAARITTLLTSKGYVTSRCIIPAQTVSDGTVILQVEENKLAQIQLTGRSSYRYDARVFSQHFHDLVGKIIHLETLNSRLKLLSKLPGTRIEPTLHKAPEGTSNLVLKITDFEDTHSLSFNNQASRYTGEFNGRYTGTLYNITGAGDSISAIFTANPLHPEFSNSLAMNYVRPFGDKGGVLQMSYTTVRYQLDPDEVGNDVVLYEGDSDTFAVRYEKPFLVDEGDFWWGIGLEKKHSTATTRLNTAFPGYNAGDTIVHGEDKLFVGELSLRATVMDSLLPERPAANTAALRVKHAFSGVFGSMTDDDVRWKLENMATAVNKLNVNGPIGNVNGLEPDFWKLYLSLSRLQMLPYRLSAVFQFDGEYTPSDKIPNAYNFVGANNGPSGYRYSLAIGRPIYEDMVNMMVGFRHATSYGHYWDENPGCGENVLIRGSYQCYADTGFLNLSFKYKMFFGDLEYQSVVNTFEQNQERIKLNIGARW